MSVTTPPARAGGAAATRTATSMAREIALRVSVDEAGESMGISKIPWSRGEVFNFENGTRWMVGGAAWGLARSKACNEGRRELQTAEEGRQRSEALAARQFDFRSSLGEPESGSHTTH